MVCVPRRGHEGEKNRIPRLVNAAMSGLLAENVLAINVVVFVVVFFFKKNLSSLLFTSCYCFR